MMTPKIHTKNYEKTIAKVLIDDREQDRKDFVMEQYAPFHPSIKHLDVGDYIFIGYNGVKIAVEYKTVNDFLTSIDPAENHLHNQVYRMVQDYDYCFVMVECKDLNKALTKRFYQTGINTTVQQVNGAVTDLDMVSTVLWSQDTFGAFDCLMRMAGKVIENKPFLWKFGRKSTNTALNYLNCIHGLRNKATDIVKTLDLHTKKDLDNLTVDDLMLVDGIGKATAMKIINELR